MLLRKLLQPKLVVVPGNDRGHGESNGESKVQHVDLTGVDGGAESFTYRSAESNTCPFTLICCCEV